MEVFVLTSEYSDYEGSGGSLLGVASSFEKAENLAEEYCEIENIPFTPFIKDGHGDGEMRETETEWLEIRRVEVDSDYLIGD